MKLCITALNDDESLNPYYPLTATGDEEELTHLMNQVILDDVHLEQESVRCNMMGQLPTNARLHQLVAWVNRHSRDLEVQLVIND
jgi:hypothetical protein